MANPKEKKGREVKASGIRSDGKAVIVVCSPAHTRTLPAPALVWEGKNRTEAARQDGPPAEFSGQKTGCAPYCDEKGQENNG
jgi:hypothetical protein